jgi:hypothetical protein
LVTRLIEERDAILEELSQKWSSRAPIRFTLEIKGSSDEQEAQLLLNTTLESEGTGLVRIMHFRNADRKVRVCWGPNLSLMIGTTEPYEAHEEPFKQLWSRYQKANILPVLLEGGVLPQEGDKEHFHETLMKAFDNVLQSTWIDKLLVEASRGMNYRIEGVLTGPHFKGKIFLGNHLLTDAFETSIEAPTLTGCTSLYWVFELATEQLVALQGHYLEQALAQAGFSLESKSRPPQEPSELSLTLDVSR